MNRLHLSMVVAMAGLVGSTGCTRSTSDANLANDIKAKLYSDQTTKPASINVAVKERAVTLSGDVPSSDVALEAMKVVNGTPGVKTVSDQMTINGAAAVSQLPDAGTPQTASAPPPPPSTNADPYASAPQNPPPNAPPPAATNYAPEEVRVPAGERVSVRTIDRIDSNMNRTGQVFRASLNTPLRYRGQTIGPAGSDATLVIAEARHSGRIEGRPVLEVRLTQIRIHGHDYPVDSSVFDEAGASRGRQTAVRTGIGAAAGAVIGAIAGGGRGAAIGTAAGGGAGFGSDFFTHGPRVRIPSESVLDFRLEAPLTVHER